MTEKEYEGTPELIFYCEYDPNNTEDRLEIPFTNKYKIELNFFRDADNKICINVDLQPKESTVPKDFFGKNILNVTAIVGKNGVGKTFLLDEFSQKKKVKENSFFIYKSLDSSKFYINNIDQYVANVDTGILDDEQIKHGSIYINFSGKLTETIYHNYNKWKFIFSEDLSFFMKIDKICQIQFEGFNPYKNLFDDSNDNNIFADGSIWGYIKNLEKNIKSSRNQINFIQEPYSKKQFIIIFWKIVYLSMLKMHKSNLENYEEYLVDEQRRIQIGDNSNDNEELDNQHNEYRNYSRRVDNLLIDSSSWEDYKTIQTLFYQSMSDKFGLDEETVDLLKTTLPLLEKIDENFFKWDKLNITETDDFIKNREYIDAVIQGIDSLLSEKAFSDVCRFSFGSFSSGEMQLIDCFARIFSEINSLYTKEVVIILLDEPDSRIHPEWSRKYLSYLLKFLDIEGERLGIKFQVILTTHSPYLISDLPKENIILFEKDEKTGKRTARKSKYGFASNYYDIMSDSFFLDDTIGEFAKQKINECIRKMNTITYLLKKIKDKNLVISKLLNKKIPIRMKGIEQIISIVGDPYIKKPLEGMLSVLIDQLNSLKPKQKSLDEILRERQIALQSSGAKND